VDALGLGEMGIGNTTAAAALLSAMVGASPADTVGRGTGVDDAGLERKIAAVEAALERHRGHLDDPLEVLRRLGGRDVAAIAGAILALAVVISQTPASGGSGARSHLALGDLPRPLLVLGALCALAYFVENAWQSWGAIHLERDLHASAGAAALAPAVFAGAAAAGRAGSQALHRRLDEIFVLHAGAGLGAAGTMLGALAPGRPLALAGIAVAGAGISVCAPNLLSIAGRHTDETHRASAVSIVTTIAYAGFVVGPAMVGLLAQATTLGTSLAAAAGVAAVLAVIAGTARR
jgi:fucose permease